MKPALEWFIVIAQSLSLTPAKSRTVSDESYFGCKNQICQISCFQLNTTWTKMFMNISCLDEREKNTIIIFCRQTRVMTSKVLRLRRPGLSYQAVGMFKAGRPSCDNQKFEGFVDQKAAWHEIPLYHLLSAWRGQTRYWTY